MSGAWDQGGSMTNSKGGARMSDSDDLLRACAELEREDQDAYPWIWEAALAGRVSIDAARSATSAVPAEDAALREVFEGPIDEAEVRGLVERILGGEAPPSGARLGSGASSSPASATVIPLRRRRWIFAAASALATAAVVLLMITRPDSRGPLVEVGYAFTPREPGIEEVRSTPAAAKLRRYRSSSSIDWVWSPDVAVKPGAVLYVVARGPADDRRLLVPGATISETGTFRLRGRVDEVLALPPGRWHLRFLVVPEDLRPADPTAALQALEAGEASDAGEIALEIRADDGR